ncbi:hypothetical protein M426DRAFT_154407 [Hypoxylon sp. CI-4A]|nr:hypothetical protein M426DRAFT_154407 [Hypoxylon sp. CI-4A]
MTMPYLLSVALSIHHRINWLSACLMDKGEKICGRIVMTILPSKRLCHAKTERGIMIKKSSLLAELSISPAARTW